jgi:hypothetical protein
VAPLGLRWPQSPSRGTMPRESIAISSHSPSQLRGRRGLPDRAGCMIVFSTSVTLTFGHD